MNYEDVKKRVEEWDTATFGKTTRDKRMYLLGMAAGADMTMGEYERLIRWIKAPRRKTVELEVE